MCSFSLSIYLTLPFILSLIDLVSLSFCLILAQTLSFTLSPSPTHTLSSSLSLSLLSFYLTHFSLSVVGSRWIFIFLGAMKNFFFESFCWASLERAQNKSRDVTWRGFLFSFTMISVKFELASWIVKRTSTYFLFSSLRLVGSECILTENTLLFF